MADKSPARASKEAVIKKVSLIEKNWANAPPMIGHINIPEVEPVTRVPRAFPLCFLGVCDAIKA